jgi:hypothetical protein
MWVAIVSKAREKELREDLISPAGPPPPLVDAVRH